MSDSERPHFHHHDSHTQDDRLREGPHHDTHGHTYDDQASIAKQPEDAHHDHALETSVESTPASPTKDKHDPVDQGSKMVTETPEEKRLDEKFAADMEIIKSTAPTSTLEIAYADVLTRKDEKILRLSNEIQKLKAFISKRKQTYKRKRKDEGAPTRALSAYNIFVQDRFAALARENEKALKSTDSEAQLKRVPPANLVASTGNQWKELPEEEKAKYAERAKSDRKRYDEQMAQYQPPDRASNRKRNKTGYNMFFSAHVLRLKQSETGVPPERGSVARLVGTAWKALSAEEKQYYEREADKHNGMHPVKDDAYEEDDEEKRQHSHTADPYAHMHQHDMHMHGGAYQQHDPRHHYPYGGYPYTQPPYGHYDYQQHHQQHHQHSRHSQSRSHGGYSHSYPTSQRNPYEGM